MIYTDKKAAVIGAGLAGTEAAMQLAKAGIKTDLYEMKPVKYSPAHESENFAELICSNSFKAKQLESATGLLKQEMRHFDSLILKVADQCAVPAGGALAVDRDKFSKLVTETIENEPLINVIRKEVTEIKEGYDAVIIAAGPLASDALAAEIGKLCGDSLAFYDAVAPIVSGDSIDLSKAFFASRYDKGNPEDYLNCPMNKEEYERFYNELVNGESATLHSFDKRKDVFEGCMPIEVMASRGEDTMRFGPMKPRGLTDPKTGRWPYAAVQLRRETLEGTMYNLVGFQTNLKFSEQKRIFSMIPGLENAEFLRYGVMHRNTFINSPALLKNTYEFKGKSGLYFAGQITGVEGYMASAMSGILAGINAGRKINGEPPLILPRETVMGALTAYISDPTVEKFQPMGPNFGLVPALPEKIRNKKERYHALALRSLEYFNGEQEEN